MAIGESAERRLPRQAIIAAAATLLLLALVATLGFEPLVRSEVSRRAEARDLRVQVGEVDIGWGGVWLKGVEISVPAIPALSARVEAVFVPLGSSAVEASSGEVSLRGTYQEVREQVSRWRGQSAGGATGGAGGSSRDVIIRGVAFTWSGVSRDEPPQRVWGINYERQAGRERVTADLLRIGIAGASLEVRGIQAELDRVQGSRVLSRFTAASADVLVDLTKRGDAGAVSTAGAVGPTRAASTQGAPPAPAEDEPAAAKIPGLLSYLSGRAQALLRAGARIEIPAFRAHLRSESDVLNFGPSRLGIERKAGLLVAALEPGHGGDLGGATPLAFRASLPLSGGADPELEVEGGPVSLGVLGVHEGDFGLFDVKHASLEAHAKLSLAAGAAGGRLRFRGNGRLRDVSLHRPALAPQPLRGIDLAWRGSAEAAIDGSRLDVTDGEITLGDVQLRATGSLERGPDFLRVKAEGGVPLAACEKLLSSAPRGFAPLLDGLEMKGTFAAALSIEADTRALDRMKVELDVENDCAITRVPEQLSPERFRRPWVRMLKGPDGLPLVVESGPGTQGFAPYDTISRYMETAVIVCEDGGFFRHRGFDYVAIEKSIKDNVRARRFVRGASTISMQLAKNLYLGKEKTLSRKFEEAILTMLLEQSFEKRELMELYLNVIEFGPGLYGIGPATRHYFDTLPSELTLGQAMYLASILPSPDRQHFGKEGGVSEGWMKYLRKLMVIARKISRVNDEELIAALEEEVAFRVPGAPPPPLSEDVSPEPPALEDLR